MKKPAYVKRNKPLIRTARDIEILKRLFEERKGFAPLRSDEEALYQRLCNWQPRSSDPKLTYPRPSNWNCTAFSTHSSPERVIAQISVRETTAERALESPIFQEALLEALLDLPESQRDDYRVAASPF